MKGKTVWNPRGDKEQRIKEVKREGLFQLKEAMEEARRKRDKDAGAAK